MNTSVTRACAPGAREPERRRLAGFVQPNHPPLGSPALGQASAEAGSFWSSGRRKPAGSRRSAAGPAVRGRRAFTLIELLLVLVILGVLAGIVVPKFAGRTEQARRTAAVTDIAAISTALDTFEVDNGYYPKSLVELVEQPRDAQNWKGPYLRSGVPLDPWKNAYIYQYPGRHNPNGYDIMSMGSDGREGSEDDITNWQQASQTPR